MATGYAGRKVAAQAQGSAVGSVGGILRLLSGGATEAILLALADGPMQTKVLTHRVRGYTRPDDLPLPAEARPAGPGRAKRRTQWLDESRQHIDRRGRPDICTVVERFARGFDDPVAGRAGRARHLGVARVCWPISGRRAWWRR